MTTNRQLLEESYIKDKLRLQEILKQLSMEQIRYIVARQESKTDGEAAVAVGISAQTVYKWPDIVNEAARLMASDGIVAATEIRRRNLTKAMIAKVGGLDSNDEKLKQGVATEIIEWEMGKAVQKQEVTGAGGKPIETKGEVTHVVDSDTAATIFDILAAAGAIGANLDDSEDNEVHTPQADA